MNCMKDGKQIDIRTMMQKTYMRSHTKLIIANHV